MNQTAYIDPLATPDGITEMIRAAWETGQLFRSTVRHTISVEKWSNTEPSKWGDIVSRTERTTDEHAIDFYFSRDMQGYSDDLQPWVVGNGMTWADMQRENAEFDKLCGTK